VYNVAIQDPRKDQYSRNGSESRRMVKGDPPTEEIPFASVIPAGVTQA